MADLVIPFLDAEDFGEPHTIKEFRRIMVSARNFSGTPSLTYTIEGQSATLSGVPTSDISADGPNYYTFYIPGVRGRNIKRQYVLVGAADLGATLDEVQIVRENIRREF